MSEMLGIASQKLPELPKGWQYKTVSEIGATGEQPVLTGPFGTNLGRGDFVKSGVPVLTIGCLTQSGINLDKALFVSEEKAQELSRYRLKEGDLLFSRMASVGRAGLVTKRLEGALFNYHIMRLRLDDQRLDARLFINYVRGAKQVRDYLKAVNHGATRDGINTEQLLGLPVAVPPLSEQREIVAEIDKQFSRLDEAVANLQRVKANLKRYKAAVLKAAVEGRLVETEASIARREGRDYETGEQLLQRILGDRRKQWSGRGKYKPPQAPVDTDADLPEGWVWASIDQLAEVGTGATPSRSNPSFWTGGDIPWVSSSVVNADQVSEATEFVTEQALAETNLTVYPPGTLLLAMYGEGKTRGKCAELRLHAATNQALAALQANADVRPYLRHFLEHNYEEMRKVASGGVQPNLNLSLVRSVCVPLPPAAEQVRISAEVDRQLTILRGVEVEVDVNLQRAHALRQSVLAKSFQQS